MPKRKKSQPPGVAPWMVSWSDLNNLLLCFFIVMMGDENPPITQEDFQLTLSSVQASLGVVQGGSTMSKSRLMEMGQTSTKLISTTTKGSTLGRVKKQADETFKPEVRSKYVIIREDERGLIITLMGDVFFESGSARLMPQVKPVLTKVAGLIKELPNYVRVEGHTDELRPVASRARGGYETNWELSAARSLNIVRFLTEEDSVNPKQLSAVALGENRPIDTNATPEGRAANRRVDIVVLKERILPEDNNPEISRPLPDEEWQ